MHGAMHNKPIGRQDVAVGDLPDVKRAVSEYHKPSVAQDAVIGVVPFGAGDPAVVFCKRSKSFVETDFGLLSRGRTGHFFLSV